MKHAPTVSLLVALALCQFIPRAATAQTPQAGNDRDSLDVEDKTALQKQLPLPALAQLLARYAHEPPVEQVVAATLRAARNNPHHFADLASRSRLRGLLPHLDLGARRGQGIDLRWTPTDDLAGNRTTADDLMLFATLRFDLDRLLFTSDEVHLTREERFAHEAHHELIRRVVHVYFLRKRLLLERDLIDASTLSQQLRIEEAEALLDAFTDGAFRRMLRQNSLATWKIGAGTNVSERR